MSVPRTKPTFIAGTPRSSGDVQTGQFQTTPGGGRAFSLLSGLILSDTMIYSGAGRLDQIVIINSAPTSGSQLLFYDAAAVSSGGPYAASGHKVIGTIPTPFLPSPTSGINPFAQAGAVINVGMPFQSGLAVGGPGAGVRSGSCGFSLSFTPEANQDQGGPFLGA